MPFDEAVDVAVRATGMFEIAESDSDDVPQALKDKLFEDGRKIMREVLVAIGYPVADGQSTEGGE